MSETVDGCHINHFVFSDNLKFDHEKIESAKLRGCVVDCVGQNKIGVGQNEIGVGQNEICVGQKRF